MADLTVTAAQLRLGMAVECRLIPMVAGADVTKGQPVYRATDGDAELGRANAVGTSKLVGIATRDAKAGETFEALYHGRLFGYNLSGLNPGATVYLSTATAGALQDTAPSTTGQVVVPVGTVHVLTDMGGTKFLFVDIPQNSAPVALA